MNVSKPASQLHTSPILTFAAQVNQKIADGEALHNLTIGDFDPSLYTIPDQLKQGIIDAYNAGQTNYPGAFGLINLRRAIQALVKHHDGIDVELDDILVASGSRPLLYATYAAIVDAGDTVVFPVPSWNNEYYAVMFDAKTIAVETTAENNFMPVKSDLEPHLRNAVLLALCSPQNPTGVVLSTRQLSDICDLVVAENKQRNPNEKPLYVMFDQVYRSLIFADGAFPHALTVNKEIGKYAVFVDGISKAFSGTGLRVGWATGPKHVIEKMRAIVSHLGAWAPKAEQFATGEFLKNIPAVEAHLGEFHEKLKTILNRLHDGFTKMHSDGLPVQSIKPQASIYLSVQLSIFGKITKSGKKLNTVDDIQRFLLEDARVAMLPFSWFGAKKSPTWFRMSVGTCSPDTITIILELIENALRSLIDVEKH